MALTAFEETVLDLHDAGRTRAQIALELDAPLGRVDGIITIYNGDAAVDGRLEREMKRGSDALLRSLRSTYRLTKKG